MSSMQMGQRGVVVTNTIRFLLSGSLETLGFCINLHEYFVETLYYSFEERDDGLDILNCAKSLFGALWAVDQVGEGGHGFSHGNDDLGKGEGRYRLELRQS